MVSIPDTPRNSLYVSWDHGQATWRKQIRLQAPPKLPCGQDTVVICFWCEIHCHRTGRQELVVLGQLSLLLLKMALPVKRMSFWLEFVQVSVWLLGYANVLDTEPPRPSSPAATTWNRIGWLWTTFWTPLQQLPILLCFLNDGPKAEFERHAILDSFLYRIAKRPSQDCGTQHQLPRPSGLTRQFHDVRS